MKFRVDALMKIFGMFVFIAAHISCVTVKVGPGEEKPSEKVNFVSPPSLFSEIKTKEADHFWLNRTNGNSISYHSRCDEAGDPNLETMQQSIFRAIDNLVVERRGKISFNSREALDSVAVGSVDGIQVRTRVVTFKKNGCNYNITYAALLNEYPKDEPTFNSFLEKFEVP